jgi:hypothetical protein
VSAPWSSACTGMSYMPPLGLQDIFAFQPSIMVDEPAVWDVVKVNSGSLITKAIAIYVPVLAQLECEG